MNISNLKREWQTKDGKTMQISDMETSHIQNCIRMIERNWNKLPEETEFLVADHWSLGGVLVEYGQDHYGEKLQMLKEELVTRKAPTLTQEAK